MPLITHSKYVVEAEVSKGGDDQIKGAVSSDEANQQKKSTSLL